MEKQRTYFVIDMKTFFASVECAERGLNPFETNLVVVDEKRGKNALCLAITPKMKKAGIHNRCRLSEIPKDVKYIKAMPQMRKYIEYASKIYEIYLNYIDKNDIHVYSIDECFLDVSDYLKLYGKTQFEFAAFLKNEIETKLHIPSTVGIGTNMFLAKIALDLTAKHTKSGIGFLNEEIFKQTLWNHTPLTDFWQIGEGTRARLEKLGIFTMQDIATTNQKVLYKAFGVNAELLIDHANGKETCTIKNIKDYKKKSQSMSGSQILPSNYNKKAALVVLKEMIQNGCYELQRNNFITQHLHIFVGYGNGILPASKAGFRFGNSTNLYSKIGIVAQRLFLEIADETKPIRKLGFAFGDLQSDKFENYDFFSNPTEIKKEKSLTQSVLKIKDRYGKNSILKGIDFEEGATQRERNGFIGGHKE